jgi:hypothetical protein
MTNLTAIANAGVFGSYQFEAFSTAMQPAKTVSTVLMPGRIDVTVYSVCREDVPLYVKVA